MNRLQYASFGARVKELREEQGISIRRLAKRAGVSKSSLSNIEAGDQVAGLETSERIASGLGLTLWQILGGANSAGIEERRRSQQMSFTTHHEISGPGRFARRRTLAGEGMLTPNRDFVWRGELFRAGVTRVAPDHEVAKSEHAPLLIPAYQRESGHEILRFLQRTRGQQARPRTRRQASDQRWRVGGESWRLPARKSWWLG
jgi:transcriptional regulator with XRE-family HTH domain